MVQPHPSPQVLAIFAALIEERAGLSYRLEEHGLLAEKLRVAMQEAGFDSLLDFYYALRYDDPHGQQTTRLIEALLVHETYFFRELRSLEHAVDHVVVPAIHREGRARVWSAACASGEEAVSLAVLLAERQLLHACEIVASDVSAPVLARARLGRHPRRSLRRDGLALAERWLARHHDEIIVPEALRAAISLRRVNLCDAAAVAAQGMFDLIVCRHVLIYFAEPTIMRVVASLTERLRPRGALLVGAAESLWRFSTGLVGEEQGGTFLYRRAP